MKRSERASVWAGRSSVYRRLAKRFGFAVRLLCLCAIALCCAQSRVSAQVDESAALGEPPGYAQLIDEAIREYRARHFEEARALFARAHELYPNARALRGMGMADFELREYVDALGHLRAALASPVRPLSGSLRAETEALAERAQAFVGRVELDLVPRNAEVTVDGSPVALDDTRELVLALGDHVLEFRAAGHASVRRSVKVRGGELMELDVELASTDRPRPPERVAEAPAMPLPIASDTRDDRRPLYKNPWLWSGVAAVVVGGAVASFLLLRDPGTKEPFVADSLGSARAP
jgi:hypothetical protein